jgi:hypothetical protein
LETIREELRALRAMHRAVALELAFCVACAAGLFVASGAVSGADRGVQILFVLCLAAFGSSTAHLVPTLVDAARFRCPRCDRLFHAASAATRPVIRLRACAHCHLAVRPHSR